MGNELSRCLKPNASLKLGRSSGPVEPDYESEVYKVAAGTMVAVAASPTSMKARLDVGGSEQPHRQQFTDLQKLQGKEVVGGVCSQVYLWILLSPGSLGRDLCPEAPFCLKLTFSGLATRDQGWLGLAPHSLFRRPRV